MRVKLNISVKLEANQPPLDLGTKKMLYFIEDSGSLSEKEPKALRIKDLLKDVRKKLNIEESLKMEAEIDGYFIPPDAPANKILKEGDVIGISFGHNFSKKEKTIENVLINDEETSKEKRKSIEDMNKSIETKAKPKKLKNAPKVVNSKPKIVTTEIMRSDEIESGPLSKSKKRKERRARMLKKLAPTELNVVEGHVPDLQPCQPLITKVDVQELHVTEAPETEFTCAQEDTFDNTGYYCEQAIFQDKKLAIPSRQLEYTKMQSVNLEFAPPIVDKWIAYKILELGPKYSPELSDYKHAKVLEFNTETEMLSLHVLNIPSEMQYDEYDQPILGKFELPGSFVNSEKGVEVEYLVNDSGVATVIPFSILEDPRHLLW